MDLHPTPFPRKSRRSVTTTKKEPVDSAKPSKTAALTARPKRAFGVARHTNIISTTTTTEKPLTTKTAKPWKPTGTAADPISRRLAPPAVATAEKAVDNVSGGTRSGKAKSDPKKTHLRVGFQETVNKEDGVHTPISSIKPAAALGTPYLSAQNCSKCRLDKLDSSSYWLQQIKLAESVGKHFVSAAFFRLALDCNAQPLDGLQSELKHYIGRHRSAISTETNLWNDLCQAYGLSDGPANTADDLYICNETDPASLFELAGLEKPNNDLEEANHDTVKVEELKDLPETVEFDASHSLQKDIPVKEPPVEHIKQDMNSDPKECPREKLEDVGIKEPVEEKLMPPSTEDSSCKLNSSGPANISHSGDKKKSSSTSSNVSGKKLYSNNSKRVPSLSCNDSLPSKTMARRSIGSAGKTREASSGTRAGSKLSGQKLTRTIGDAARSTLSGEPRTKVEEVGKVTAAHLSENMKPCEAGEEVITY